MLLISLATTTLPYTGSGSTSRLGTFPFLGTSLSSLISNSVLVDLLRNFFGQYLHGLPYTQRQSVLCCPHGAPVSAPLSSKKLRYYYLVITSDTFSVMFSTSSCYFLGLLAPYLDLACLLSATPAVSRVPLTMWYLTPGRSFTLPPLMSTTLCS